VQPGVTSFARSATRLSSETGWTNKKAIVTGKTFRLTPYVRMLYFPTCIPFPFRSGPRANAALFVSNHARRDGRSCPHTLMYSVRSRARNRSEYWGSPRAPIRCISSGFLTNRLTIRCIHVWLIPSCFAQDRADGRLRSRHVNHNHTNRRISSDSSLLRHGRGACQCRLARALARFLSEDS